MKLIEDLLARLIGAELAEAMLGDLQELRPTVEARWGTAVSWVWLGLEVLRGALVLTADRWGPTRWRRKEKQTMESWNERARRAAAVIGLLACLPAAVLVAGGLLQSDWSTPALRAAMERTLFNSDLIGFRVLIHPATILSGLLLAAGLNLLPLLRVGIERRPGALVGTLALRIRAAQLGVAVLAVGLLGVILGYAFVENYRVVPTHVDVETSEPRVQVEGAAWAAPYDRLLQRRLILFAVVPGTEIMRLDNGQSGWRYGAALSSDGAWLMVPTPPANGS